MQRYPNSRILLHWLTAAVVVAAFAMQYAIHYLPLSWNTEEQVRRLHFYFGLGVAVFMLIRLVWFCLNPHPPAIDPPLRFLMRAIATATHLLLYVTFIALPLLGAWQLASMGETVPLPAWFMPELPVDFHLAAKLAQWHRMLATLALELLVVHILAALYHHFIRKDNTLKRMWLRR